MSRVMNRVEVSTFRHNIDVYEIICQNQFRQFRQFRRNFDIFHFDVSTLFRHFDVISTFRRYFDISTFRHIVYVSTFRQ